MDSSDPLLDGHQAYDRHDWTAAFGAFLRADERQPLCGEALWRFATTAFLVGREPDFQRLLERSYRAHGAAGQPEAAARDAFWLSFTLLSRGEVGQANGWIARGERLVQERDCAERGYLLLMVVEQQLGGGQAAAAQVGARTALQLGERHGDLDLVAAARHLLGRAAIQLGEPVPGLKLLDETMLAVVAGEIGLLMTGLMYCSVISACLEIREIGRAREWTSALSCWCERQSGMIAFTDTCLVHRAEILQFQGSWLLAADAARRVCERCDANARVPSGAALYQLGEIHRLRGEDVQAEAAYRAASDCGFEPQPGLALLRLAQGRSDAAAAALRRLTVATTQPLRRARLLPAHVEAMLAVGDLAEAQHACDEMTALGEKIGTPVLRAQSAQARGVLARRHGDHPSALAELRSAFEWWAGLDMPFEAARVRVQMGAACLEIGDAEASQIEFDAARATFERLGARAELACLRALRGQSRGAGPLSTRELQVLRMVAEGRTNKGIARALNLSERTIDRHVSSILAKLRVPSRAAATAHAISRRLIDSAGGNHPIGPMSG